MALYYLLRTNFPIDTAGLDDGAVISAATFNVKGVAPLVNNDADAQAYLAIVQTSQVSNTSLVIGDFDEWTTTKGSADVTNSTLSTTAYNVFTLNATGLGWINKTGFTKLGLREGHEIENLAVAARNSMACAMSETADTTSDPYLEVTYTIPEASTTTRRKFIRHR